MFIHIVFTFNSRHFAPYDCRYIKNRVDCREMRSFSGLSQRGAGWAIGSLRSQTRVEGRVVNRFQYLAFKHLKVRAFPGDYPATIRKTGGRLGSLDPQVLNPGIL